MCHISHSIPTFLIATVNALYNRNTDCIVWLSEGTALLYYAPREERTGGLNRTESSDYTVPEATAQSDRNR